MKLFTYDDFYQVWAGETLEECMKAAKSSVIEEWEEITDDAGTYVFTCEESDQECTFAEILRHRIHEGQKFPQLFTHRENNWTVAGEGLLSCSTRQCHGMDSTWHVFFYEHDFYVLSNFSAFSIYFNGIQYPTSEHAYQAAKFMGMNNITATETADRIRWAKSAHEAFKIAEEMKNFRNPEWDKMRIDAMTKVLRAKVQQHSYVRRKLMDTGFRKLVENSWRDDFWGTGPDNDGANILGKLWMEIRKDIRNGKDISWS